MARSEEEHGHTVVPEQRNHHRERLKEEFSRVCAAV